MWRNLWMMFFRDNNLSWNMVSAVCSGKVLVMLGWNFDFGALVKANALHIIDTHCVLHRHMLATKTLPQKMAVVLKIVMEYLWNMKDDIFKELYNEKDAELDVLLYHSNVQWLSREKVLNRVCNAYGISPVFSRAPTLSCKLLWKL